MKIAIVSSSVSRAAGGIFEIERRLSLELAVALGHEVEVFSGEDAHSMEDAHSWLPLRPKLYPCIGPRTFGYSSGMSEGLAEWKPDVVHLHNLWMYPSIAVSRWSKLTGRPYMITLHGMLDAWALKNSSWKKKLALSLYERQNLDGAACIQVNSEAEGKSAREFGLKNPLVLIPNGIDIPRKAPGQWGSKRKNLLYLGRLHPKKGLMNLLRAWQEIRALTGISEWVLTIAGWAESGHDEELRKLADELNIPYMTTAEGDGNGKMPLVFLGPQFGADKESCLRGCDGFILPSLSEGLPMAVLEAWAYIKPVVMTPMCNLPDGFAAGAAIEANADVLSLQKGILDLIQMTDGERLAMGRNGRKLVESRFTWSNVGCQMAEVYRWMVEGGGAPSCVMS